MRNTLLTNTLMQGAFISLIWTIPMWVVQLPISQNEVSSILTFIAVVFGFYIASVPLIFKAPFIDLISKNYTDKRQLIIDIALAYKTAGALTLVLFICLLLYQYLINIPLLSGEIWKLIFSTALATLTFAVVLMFWRLLNNCLYIFAKSEMYPTLEEIQKKNKKQ